MIDYGPVKVKKKCQKLTGMVHEQFDFRKIPNKVRVRCKLCNRDPGFAVRRKSPEPLISCVYLAVSLRDPSYL